MPVAHAPRRSVESGKGKGERDTHELSAENEMETNKSSICFFFMYGTEAVLVPFDWQATQLCWRPLGSLKENQGVTDGTSPQCSGGIPWASNGILSLFCCRPVANGKSPHSANNDSYTRLVPLPEGGFEAVHSRLRAWSVRKTFCAPIMLLCLSTELYCGTKGSGSSPGGT